MPQVFTLSDGSKVEYPDGPLTREETAWLRQSGGMEAPSVGTDVAKSSVSGLAEGVIRAPFVANDMAGLATAGFDKVFPGARDQSKQPVSSNDVLRMLETLPLMASNAYNKVGLTKLGQYERDIYDKYQTEGMLHTPETQAGRYANSMGNAAGGLALGGTGAMRGPIALNTSRNVLANAGRAVVNSPVTTAAGIGAAGEFAGDVSRGFDETKEQNPLMRFAGSSAAAVLAALRGRLSRAPAARPLHEVTKDLSPEDFAQARAETARLQRAGTTQNTVGDSLPTSSRVAAMEREVSNEMGAGPLAQKLAGRTSRDIPDLEAASVADIRHQVVPGAVPPPGTPNVSEWVAQQARNARGNATREVLAAAPPVTRDEIAQVVARLRSAQMRPQNRGTVDADYMGNAARTIARAPQYPLAGGVNASGRMSGATPVTPLNGAGNPPPMPGTITPLANAQRALPAPMSNALAVPEIPAGAVGPRVFGPEDFAQSPRPGSGYVPSGASPDVSTVTPRMAVPRVPTGANLEALAKLVKSLDTTGAKVEGPTAGMFKARGAIEAKNLANTALREVNPSFNRAMQSHADMSPGVDALKVLADNPRALAAQPGMQANPVREALAAHLSQLDAGVAGRVGERTRAADILSRNTAQHGMQGLQQELGRSPLGEVVTPISSLGQGLRIASKQQANAQISQLLANPTPANFAILEKLARNNPDLARALVKQGYTGAVNATTQTEGSQP